MAIERAERTSHFSALFESRKMNRRHFPAGRQNTSEGWSHSEAFRARSVNGKQRRYLRPAVTSTVVSRKNAAACSGGTGLM